MTLGIVLLIYFASIVDGLKIFLFVTGLVLLTLAFISIPVLYDLNRCDDNLFGNIDPLKAVKRFLTFSVISFVLCALTPNERQVYYMSAAYIGGTTIETIANSPEMSKVRIIVNKKWMNILKRIIFSRRSKTTNCTNGG